MKKTWSGTSISSLQPNEVFVFGSNPEGRHGAGAAKVALQKFGAKYGVGRGLQGSSYALITKNLKAGFVEPGTGIAYPTEGYCSVSKNMIVDNIKELYEVARTNPQKEFYIGYTYDTYPNGQPKKSLNGYTSQETVEMFCSAGAIPDNIVFHDSFQARVETILNTTQTQTVSAAAPKTATDTMAEPKAQYSVDQKFVYFFSLHSPFSNFHPAAFVYKDHQFFSSEQFMMFCKAKMFNDETVAQKILNANTHPLVQQFLSGATSRKQIIADKELAKQWNDLHKSIKGMGREVRNYNDALWSKMRFKIVGNGVKHKFAQNPELRSILMNTPNDALFVEASPFDKIWGIGLNETQAKNTPSAQWPGQNLLGLILDKVKQYCIDMTAQTAQQAPVQPINEQSSTVRSETTVANFYHLGQCIPDNSVYIGRYNAKNNLNKSLYSNPFKVESPEQRGSTIEAYREYFWERVADGTFSKDGLRSLAGQQLVCYCKPLACHGDVLKEAVDLLVTNEATFDATVEQYKQNLHNKVSFKP